jgi:hypothetical protein
VSNVRSSFRVRLHCGLWSVENTLVANERRIRLLGVTGTLGGAMLSTDTALTFGAVPGFATIGSTAHAAIILEPATTREEIVYLTAYTAGSLGPTGTTLVRAQEGTTAVAHGINVPWVHGPTVRDNAMGRIAQATRLGSGQSVTISSGTLVAIDSTGALDVTVSGYVADWIEVGLNAQTASLTSTNIAQLAFDAATYVSAAPVNYLSSGTATAATSGVGGWFATNTTVSSPLFGSVFYRLQAADISANTVTVRLYAKFVSGTGVTSRAVDADSTSNCPLVFWVKNHGPAEN